VTSTTTEGIGRRLTVEYVLTYDDYQDSFRAHKPWHRTNIVAGMMACVVLVLVGALLLYLRASGFFPPDSVEARLGLGSGALAIGAFGAIVYVSQVVVLRNLFRRLAGAAEHTQVEISEEQITATSRATAVRIEWNRFVRAKESPGAFLLYCDADQYILVPKRAFRDNADVAAFRSLVGEKVRA